MSYTWTDGELITAEKLNNTGGDGAAVFEIVADEEYDWIINATAQEIADAFMAEKTVYISDPHGWTNGGGNDNFIMSRGIVYDFHYNEWGGSILFYGIGNYEQCIFSSLSEKPHPNWD